LKPRGIILRAIDAICYIANACRPITHRPASVRQSVHLVVRPSRCTNSSSDGIETRFFHRKIAVPCYQILCRWVKI